MKIQAKLIIMAFVTALLIGCGSDRSDDVEISLIPYQDSASMLWGFIDTEGNIAIKAKFNREPGFFKEGFSLIFLDSGYFDYIDKTGALQGKKYKFASEFSEGLACVVEENGAPQYIDAGLKKVFELKNAREAGMFSEGLARFRDTSGYWGFVDKSGKIAIKPTFNSVSCFSDGCAYALSLDKNGKTLNALIDSDGEFIKVFNDPTITFRTLSEGFSAMSKGKGWGYVDKKGAEVIPVNPYWRDATIFYNGYASVQENELWGVINTSGKYAIKPKYNMPLIFFNELAMFDENGKKGFVNAQGEIVIKAQFVDVALPFIGENAIVSKGDGYILINRDGEQVGKNKFGNVSRNYYRLKNNEDLLKSDFFDAKGIAAALISNVGPEGINGVNNSMSSADVMKLFKVKIEGVRDNPYDTSLIVTKSNTLDFGLNTHTNVKFKAFNGKTRMLSINMSLRLPHTFYEKLPLLMSEIKNIFVKAGFKVKGGAAQYYFESPKSWASVAQRSSRLEIEFNYIYQ